MYRFGEPKSLDTITAKDVIDNKLWVWETKEMNINIKESIEEMTAALLRMADDICYNRISRKVVYFTRLIKEKQKKEGFEETDRNTFQLYKKGKFLTAEQLVTEIKKHQKYLNEVDLNLYFSSAEKTVVLACLIFTEKKNWFSYKLSERLIFHCGIKISPSYSTNQENGKMDVNWHLDKFFAKMTKEEIKFLVVVFRQIYLSIQRVNDAEKEAYFEEQKLAVECEYWQLYRYNPEREAEGQNPMQLDSKEPDWSKFQSFLKGEVRYTALQKQFPAEAEELFQAAEANARWRYKQYRRMAEQSFED